MIHRTYVDSSCDSLRGEDMLPFKAHIRLRSLEIFDRTYQDGVRRIV